MRKALLIIFGILVLMMLSIAFGQATTARAQAISSASNAAPVSVCEPVLPNTGLTAGETIAAEAVESIALSEVPLGSKVFLGLVCGLAVLMALFPLFGENLEASM